MTSFVGVWWNFTSRWDVERFVVSTKYLSVCLFCLGPISSETPCRMMAKFCTDSHTRLHTVGDRAFPVTAARVWNSLPDLVTSAPSVAVFRSRLPTPVIVQCLRSDSSCFGHYNRSCLLTYQLQWCIGVWVSACRMLMLLIISCGSTPHPATLHIHS